MIGLKERKFVSSFNEISPEKLIGSVKELIKLGEKSKDLDPQVLECIQISV